LIRDIGGARMPKTRKGVDVEEVKIENSGPIGEPFAMKFPVGGGILVLKGHNGVGKSTAQATVQRMLGGSQPLSATDGAARGTAEGLGVRLTIAGSVRRSGECRGIGLEGRFDLSKFVAPGVAEGEAADARRIKALLAMTGVQGSPGAFATVCDDMELIVSSDAINEPDVVEQARKIKASLEQHARKLESDRDKSRGRAEAAWGAAGSITQEDAAAYDAGRADAEHEDAVARKARLAEQRRQYSEAQGRAAKAREALARAGSGPSVEACQARSDAAQKAQQAAMDAYRASKAEAEAATAALESAKREAATSKAAHEAVAAGARVTDATDADILEADARVAETRERVQRGQVIMEARRTFAEAKNHEQEAHRLTEQSEAIRGAAKRTDDVLSALVKSDRIAIRAGRLYVEHARRGATLLADLSAGELAKIGIMEAVDAFRKTDTDGRMPVLVVAQELWQDLDPDARADLDAMARREHVCLLPAEATDGPLRAEVFKADAAEHQAKPKLTAEDFG
jgi:hypothetical protein